MKRLTEKQIQMLINHRYLSMEDADMETFVKYYIEKEVMDEHPATLYEEFTECLGDPNEQSNKDT